LRRPRVSVVMARSGGQPGLSTEVIRGILPFSGGAEDWRGGNLGEEERVEKMGLHVVLGFKGESGPAGSCVAAAKP
jgi:hypothetical protein